MNLSIGICTTTGREQYINKHDASKSGIAISGGRKHDMFTYQCNDCGYYHKSAAFTDRKVKPKIVYKRRKGKGHGRWS